MLNVFQRVKEKRRDMAKYTVAVAGATGYAGGEALRILAAHPNFEVTCAAGHSSVGDKLGKHMPHIPQLADLVVEDTTQEVLNAHDVVILALPHGAYGALASPLDPNGVEVDMGADHRLEEKSAWDAFYGGDFYQHWTYGMPELITGVAADGSYSRQREALPGTKRIAGPGCNVTATTLALPIMFVECIFYRAADGKLVAAHFGLITGAEIISGVARQCVGVFRVLERFAVMLQAGIQR